MSATENEPLSADKTSANPNTQSLIAPVCAQVIPLEELGRPRVDVVVNCSGVFRDLFVNQVGASLQFALQSLPGCCKLLRAH